MKIDIIALPLTVVSGALASRTPDVGFIDHLNLTSAQPGFDSGQSAASFGAFGLFGRPAGAAETVPTATHPVAESFSSATASNAGADTHATAVQTAQRTAVTTSASQEAASTLRAVTSSTRTGTTTQPQQTNSVAHARFALLQSKIRSYVEPVTETAKNHLPSHQAFPIAQVTVQDSASGTQVIIGGRLLSPEQDATLRRQIADLHRELGLAQSAVTINGHSTPHPNKDAPYGPRPR